MRRLQDEGYVQSKAWVIMPDHLHWLLDLIGEKSLTCIMKLLKGRSAQRINMYLMRKGVIWSRAYHDHALRREEDIKEIARYIICKPIRPRLVDAIGKYPLWDAEWL
jgi:putative transposase